MNDMALGNFEVGVDAVVHMAAMVVTNNCRFRVVLAMVVVLMMPVHWTCSSHLYSALLVITDAAIVPEESVQREEVEQLQSRQDEDEEFQDFRFCSVVRRSQLVQGHDVCLSSWA